MFGEHRERDRDLLAQQAAGHLIGGLNRLGVLDQVPELRVTVGTQRGMQRHRHTPCFWTSSTSATVMSNTPANSPRVGSRPRSTSIRAALPGHLVDRSTTCTGTRMVRAGSRQRPVDRLPDPPRGIRGELVPLGVVELLHRPDQPQVPLLDQVQEQQPAPGEPLRQRTTRRRFASTRWSGRADHPRPATPTPDPTPGPRLFRSPASPRANIPASIRMARSTSCSAVSSSRPPDPLQVVLHRIGGGPRDRQQRLGSSPVSASEITHTSPRSGGLRCGGGRDLGEVQGQVRLQLGLDELGRLRQVDPGVGLEIVDVHAAWGPPRTGPPRAHPPPPAATHQDQSDLGGLAPPAP